MTAMVNKEKILIVDDEPNTLEVLQRNLSSQGFTTFTAASVSDALLLLKSTPVDLVITDLKMPGASGLNLVRHVRENLKDTEVLMITGYASVEGAVEAIKTGAEGYLAKPFTDEELLSAVKEALDKLNRRKATRVNSNEVTSTFGLIGASPVMKEVYKAIQKASETSATVLITGESGTGKELVARAIHYNSPRAAKPFVPVNCGGIPESLLESELFGHLKGSFTGATETRAGFFQTAEYGTIFLDEISETSLAMQVKLLRVLQDKEIYMVGATKSQKVDVRIIAATNKDLHSLVNKNMFREDLFFRLNVLTISIPPLRERGNDILALTKHFTEKFAKEYGKSEIVFTDEALMALTQYDWPGNVRELENIIQRLVLMSESSTIDVTDLPLLMRYSVPRISGLNRSLAEIESEHIKNVLVSVNGNKTKAAKILGIDRKTLREKLKNYGLTLPE